MCEPNRALVARNIPEYVPWKSGGSTSEHITVAKTKPKGHSLSKSADSPPTQQHIRDLSAPIGSQRPISICRDLVCHR